MSSRNLGKDYWSEIDGRLKEIKNNLDTGVSIDKSLLFNELLLLEKKTRLAGDAKSTAAICVFILDICYNKYNDIIGVCDYLSLLFKRRAQLQKSQESLTIKAVEILSLIEKNSDNERKLIDTIRKVTEGRIFVELERARVTRLLCHRLEKKGSINEAADLLNEIQAETIGSMDVLEKGALICEQYRLCLLKKDLVRAEIQAKKFDIKSLNDESIINDKDKKKKSLLLKIRFFQLQIANYSQEQKYFDMAKSFRDIYATINQLKDSDNNNNNKNNNTNTNNTITDLQSQSLMPCIIFSLLAKFDNEVSDALARILTEEDTLIVLGTQWKELVIEYTSNELMHWPINNLLQWRSAFEALPNYSNKILQTPLNHDNYEDGDTWKLTLNAANNNDNTMDIDNNNSINKSVADKCIEALHRRIIEHNIRVLSLYYTRISTSRFSELLQLSDNESETILSSMVTSGQCYARIDRRESIINFQKPIDSNEIINQWADDLNSLNALVERTCHLINKEFMIHKIK